MKILAIIHGRAPMKAPTIARLEAWAEGHSDIYLEVHETQGHFDALRRSKESAGFNTVLSCGGDGTNNEVLNGLMTIQPLERPTLAILPLGSGNDFARILPQRSTIELLSAIEKDQPNSVDILEIRTPNKQWFALNMITCGIGAEIAATVNRRKFSLPPAFNYYSGIIQWLMKYKAPLLALTSDAGTSKSRTFLGAFGNGTYAGNGLGLNPQSAIADGLMGVSIVGNVGVIDFLRYQSTLKKAQKVQDERLQYSTSTSAKIRVIEGTCAFETDGEVLDRLEAGEEAVIDLLPGTILLI